MYLKNNCFNIYLVAMVMLVATGCGDKAKEHTRFQSGYFDLQAYIDVQTGQLGKQPKILEKTAYLNGKTEHREVTINDSAKWSTELAPFLDADINKSALVKRYSVDTIRQGDTTIVDYKALDQKLRSRELKLYFKGADRTAPYKLEAQLKSDKIFYSSYQYISYTAGGEYEAVGNQHVVFSKPDTFAIHARFKP